MGTEARDYPIRIYAGHQGGGRRTWKPELMDEIEAAHSCEYVRADVSAGLLHACRRLLTSIHAHAETGEVHPYLTVETEEAVAAIRIAEADL